MIIADIALIKKATIIYLQKNIKHSTNPEF